MIFELSSVILAHGPAARRLTRVVDRLTASGDQIMPIGQRLPSRAEAIGARVRKPVEAGEILAIELHAIRNAFHPVLIVEAPAIAPVEQLAGDIGRIEQPRLFILKLVNAAAAAAVTQRLPLAAVQRNQRLLPKWRLAVHDKESLALLTATNQAGMQEAKPMKSLKIVLAVAGIGFVSAPVQAQLGPDSHQFIDAVQKRDGDRATQLITDHPTIINAKDEKGDTGLIIAIRRDDEDWTAFLLNKGADPNLAGANGDTPLITAARAGFDEAAEWLIGMGAQVDETNKAGETALIVAVQQRDIRLVRLLLDDGANPDQADAAAGYSARDYASRDPHTRDILQVIERKKPKPNKSAAN